jgi:hypothetical protein
MTTTFQKRQKELKRQEKQKAKTEKRRNKPAVKREDGQHGPPIADANEDNGFMDTDYGRDIENPS